MTTETAPKNNVIEGKPRPSLLPMDVLIKHVTPAYEEGVLKYERESWRRGFPVSVMVDAAQRHINAFFYENENFDPYALELGVEKHHLAGAIFSLLSILHTLEHHPQLDDRRSHHDGSSLPVPSQPLQKPDVPEARFALGRTGGIAARVPDSSCESARRAMPR